MVIMVQTDKITGQMVMSEDGIIISSSGDLSSNEAIAQHIISLISQTFPIAFKVPSPALPAPAGGSKQSVPAVAINNGSSTDLSGGSCTSPRLKRIVRQFPWKSVTVDFGSHCYVVCLSNRKVHVVRREKIPTEHQ